MEMDKNKKKNIIVGSITLLFVGIGGYLGYKFIKNRGTSRKERKLTDDNTQNLKNSIKTPDGYVSPTKQKATDNILDVGRKGQKVAILQALINWNYDTSMKVDGDLGSETKTVLNETIFKAKTEHKSINLDPDKQTAEQYKYIQLLRDLPVSLPLSATDYAQIVNTLTYNYDWNWKDVTYAEKLELEAKGVKVRQKDDNTWLAWGWQKLQVVKKGQKDSWIRSQERNIDLKTALDKYSV